MSVWPRRMIRFHVFVAVLLAALIGVCAPVFGDAWLASLGPLVGAGYFFVATRRYLKRRRLLEAPCPPEVRRVLAARVPFYLGLDAEGRERFERDVRIFLAEQRIFADQGAKLDDDTRVLIGASAAMLCHGLPDWEWPTLRDIVVYPTAFGEDYRAGAAASIAGMVHAQGPILISQRDLRHGFSRPKDGHNVALHELAHVMDFGDGRADGVPAEMQWVATAPWIGVVADRLKKIRRRRYPKVLRDYAGTNEAELFAVAVEAFFERPEELRGKDPELYQLLRDYFAQDPAKRSAGTPTGTSTAAKPSK